MTLLLKTTILQRLSLVAQILVNIFEKFIVLFYFLEQLPISVFSFLFSELKIDKTNIDQREIRFPDPTSMNLSRNLEDSYTFLELPKQGGHAEKGIHIILFRSF